MQRAWYARRSHTDGLNCARCINVQLQLLLHWWEGRRFKLNAKDTKRDWDGNWRLGFRGGEYPGPGGTFHVGFAVAVLENDPNKLGHFKCVQGFTLTKTRTTATYLWPCYYHKKFIGDQWILRSSLFFLFFACLLGSSQALPGSIIHTLIVIVICPVKELCWW
jgi:hypothetical protein